MHECKNCVHGLKGANENPCNVCIAVSEGQTFDMFEPKKIGVEDEIYKALGKQMAIDYCICNAFVNRGKVNDFMEWMQKVVKYAEMG